MNEDSSESPTKSKWIWLAVTMLCSGPLLWNQAFDGWIPHDEGLLALSAERVLDGEWPHVDFDDPYTGGQAYFHAIGFQVFGARLASLRLLLMFSTLGFSVAFYLLALRLAKPWIAAVTTLTAVVWTIPNYPGSLPSWYNLFLATLGAFFLSRFDLSEKRSLLLLAGLCGGVSILFKISGLYFIAAGLLFLVLRCLETGNTESCTAGQNTDTAAEAPIQAEGGFGQFPCRVIVTAGLVAFSLALCLLVRKRLTAMDAIHFVAPGVVLSCLLIWRAWIASFWPTQLKQLLANVLLFAFGVAIPLAVFIAPYAFQGHVGELLHGVFVLPQKRFELATYALPPLSTLAYAIPIGVLLLLPSVAKRELPERWIAIIASALGAMLLLIGGATAVYQAVWFTLRPLVPTLVLVGGFVLVQFWRNQGATPAGRDRVLRNRMLFLCLCLVAMTSLIQFPYSYGIYFCYAAPFVVLSFLAVATTQEYSLKRVHMVVLIFFLGFALLWLNRGHIRRIGVAYIPERNTEMLLPGRGDIRIAKFSAEFYASIVEEIKTHSKDGDYIYATQDCPEFYFLSNRKNPFPTFYELFDDDFSGDATARTSRVLKRLEATNVNVVLIRWKGEFSGRLPNEIATALTERFPNVRHFSADPSPGAKPLFTVAWR